MREDTSALKITSGRKLTKNALWNLLGLGTPMLVAIIAIPLLIKGLGTDRFGILTLAWMVIGYFNLFDLGLGRALTKIVAEKLGAGSTNEIPVLIWTAITLMAFLGALGAALGAGLSPWLVYQILKMPATLKAETLSVFYLLALTIPLVITTAGLRGILEAYQRFDLTNAVRIPMGVVNFLGPLAVLPFSSNLIPVVAVLVSGRIMAWGAYLMFCFHIVPGLRSNMKFNRKMILPLVRFGGWMTVSNVISPIMVYLDRFLIAALLSVTAVAYYTTPWEVVTKLLIIPGALAGVLFPAFSTALNQTPQHAVQLYQKGLKYVFILLFPITLTIVLFAQDVLRLWLDADFANISFRVMQLLTIGVFINGIAAIPFAFIQGQGRPDITAKFHLLEVILYLPGAVWSISSYGIQGASVAWVLRVGIDVLLLVTVIKRQSPEIKVKHRRYALTALLSLTALIAAMLPSGLALKTAFFLVIAVVFVIYVWLALFRSAGLSMISSKVQTLLKWT